MYKTICSDIQKYVVTKGMRKLIYHFLISINYQLYHSRKKAPCDYGYIETNG